MCDALSLSSAFGDVVGGFMGASDARHQGRMAAMDTLSAAKFEAAQIDAMRVINSADVNDAAAAIHAQFAEIQSNNIAAMAVSGLAPGSFDSIKEGNRADSQKAQAGLARNARRQDQQLALQKRTTMRDARTSALMIESGARASARAAIFSGFTSAAQTVYQADLTWRQAKPVSHNADGSVRVDGDGAAIPLTRGESIFGEGTRIGSMFRRA